MEIKLHLTTTGWIADFMDDDEINRLFGCTLIPTAFGASADPILVVAEIQRLNPGAQVSIAS